MLDAKHSRGDGAARDYQPSRESVFRSAQGAVGMRARRGEPLSSIEDEVIAPSDLPDEHKSALSLHAEMHLEDGRQRYQQRQEQVRRRARRVSLDRGGE